MTAFVLTPAMRMLACALLAAMEALRLVAYQDTGGIWTIAVGSTVMPDGRRVQRGDTLTQAQAMALLGHQVDAWAAVIARCITVPLADSWGAVLISFVHQEGVAALPGSVLAEMVNAQLWYRAGRQLNGWVIGRVNGVRRPILGIERRMEAQRQIGFGAPLEPTRTQVWQWGDATLRPLYTAACADALAWRHGVQAWDVVPDTVPTHPATATAPRLLNPVAVKQPPVGPATADLNDAELSRIKGA